MQMSKRTGKKVKHLADAVKKKERLWREREEKLKTLAHLGCK